MKRNKNVITVFEHQHVTLHNSSLTEGQLKALQVFYGEQGVSYYDLIHNGVRFNEYVGAIQVGNTLIEVLPKADKSDSTETQWRNILISMLRTVGFFHVYAPTRSDLTLKPNSILDLYFELFVKELESLLHRGLIKKYRKTEGNQKALKGSILFSKNISKNLVHKERVYVRYTTYDKDHKIHRILYKALKLLSSINTNVLLNSRIGALLLDFPEMNDIKISASLFQKIVYNRKTMPYKTALQIARLLLLNYHPDVKGGNNDVLALMFDMNLLWEKFVYKSLWKDKGDKSSKIESVKAQGTKNFWKPNNGNSRTMRPDIVINYNDDEENCVVLDTKWKNLDGGNPSPEDLRQMYVYMKYWKAKQVALVYPGDTNAKTGGHYYNYDNNLVGDEECSLISIKPEKDITSWQESIFNKINRWITECN